jgi:hypothetical protein
MERHLSRLLSGARELERYLADETERELSDLGFSALHRWWRPSRLRLSRASREDTGSDASAFSTVSTVSPLSRSLRNAPVGRRDNVGSCRRPVVPMSG